MDPKSTSGYGVSKIGNQNRFLVNLGGSNKIFMSIYFWTNCICSRHPCHKIFGLLKLHFLTSFTRICRKKDLNIFEKKNTFLLLFLNT